MLAHIVAGDVRQAGGQMLVAPRPRRWHAADRLPAGLAAISRQHQARVRFRPSRWAILPSVRSVTVAGVNRVAGSLAGEARQEAVEPGRELVRAAAAGACTRPPSASATGSRRRTAPRPGQSRSSPVPARAFSRSSAASAVVLGRRRIVGRQRKAKAVLKCTPRGSDSAPCGRKSRKRSAKTSASGASVAAQRRRRARQLGPSFSSQPQP